MFRFSRKPDIPKMPSAFITVNAPGMAHRMVKRYMDYVENKNIKIKSKIKKMKTYYFEYNGGWIGGCGVVTASNKTEALNMANENIKQEPLSHGLITKSDLKECTKNKCIIIRNGDY